jgi:3-isopropylmalate/(R)-2-methylmalate dehydratase small subunit
MANQTISGHCFSLPRDNIDTDQIIPAKFLTTTGRDGLGQFCFHHWRFDDTGCEHEHHPLRGYEAQRHAILVTGHNFGCGSSREHAPWALLEFAPSSAPVSPTFSGPMR